MKKTARDRKRIPIELPAIATSMNGGVLSNKRTDTVIARGVKTWEATAFQAGLDHVKVELTLQYRLKSNELGDDDDWKNTDTIEELRGFQAENHLTGVVEEELPPI